MQERLTRKVLNDNNLIEPEVDLVEEELLGRLQQIDDAVEMESGYVECMEEAMRYLVHVEKYPEDHPALLALRSYLYTRGRDHLIIQ